MPIYITYRIPSASHFLLQLDRQGQYLLGHKDFVEGFWFACCIARTAAAKVARQGLGKASKDRHCLFSTPVPLD